MPPAAAPQAGRQSRPQPAARRPAAGPTAAGVVAWDCGAGFAPTPDPWGPAAHPGGRGLQDTRVGPGRPAPQLTLLRQAQVLQRLVQAPGRGDGADIPVGAHGAQPGGAGAVSHRRQAPALCGGRDVFAAGSSRQQQAQVGAAQGAGAAPVALGAGGGEGPRGRAGPVAAQGTRPAPPAGPLRQGLGRFHGARWPLSAREGQAGPRDRRPMRGKLPAAPRPPRRLQHSRPPRLISKRAGGRQSQGSPSLPVLCHSVPGPGTAEPRGAGTAAAGAGHPHAHL